MSNLDIWNKYKEVPDTALKSFNNGSFKGTDINTMWRIKCLTEEFGVCGIGWYFDIVRTWVEKSNNTKEKMSHAEIKLYIKDPEMKEWSKGITGIGGNKLETFIKSGDYWKLNDECYKMAVTDALGNACKNLGFGADVYWSNDRTKYSESDKTNKLKPTKENQIMLVASANGLTMEQVKEWILKKFGKTSFEDLSTSEYGELIRAMEIAV